jgi:NADH:ubiquinone oxidoreductase subunit E
MEHAAEFQLDWLDAIPCLLKGKKKIIIIIKKKIKIHNKEEKQVV